MISSRGNRWLSMLKNGSPGRYADFILPADEINAQVSDRNPHRSERALSERLLKVAGLLLALCVSGCTLSKRLPEVSSPEIVKVRTVSIVPIGVPTVPRVRILNSGSDWFWVPGVLAEGAYSGVAGAQVGDLVNNAGFDYGSEAARLFEKSVADSGLSIVRVASSAPSADRNWPLAKCPKEPVGDACLDIRLTYFGYVAAFASSDYVPTVHASVRMIRMSDGKLLFERNIHYNPIDPGRAVDVFASSEFRFHDLDAMRADPQGVVAGLRIALSALASELGSQLQGSLHCKD